MGKTLADIWNKAKPDRGALRKLRSRLRGCGRTLALGVACVLVLLASGKLNFALAVDMGGDVIGYVSSREELNTIVENVQESVSGALGYDWAAPELTTRVMLGESETIAVENASVVADRLLETAENVGSLYLVYVDGEAVCAFETGGEAAEALRNLKEKYVSEHTEKAAFAETVTVAVGMADRSLLENNVQVLEKAVTVLTTSRVTVETVLPYETVTETDSEMYEDETVVRTPGADGLLVAEYLVNSRNGNLVDHVQTNSNRYAPVTEVVVQGTRTRHSAGQYIWPVDSAYISSSFGYRVSIGSSDHQGIDLANDAGTPIYASDGGVVIFADTYKGFGLIVKIQHDNGDVTYYAHCSSILVSEGELVEQGEEIALMGATGVATGNHVHFELHPGGGDAVDPMDYLPPCDFEYLDD